MSRNVALNPVVSRSGTAKIATPPPARTGNVALVPTCRQFSGTQTATPDVAGSQ